MVPRQLQTRTGVPRLPIHSHDAFFIKKDSYPSDPISFARVSSAKGGFRRNEISGVGLYAKTPLRPEEKERSFRPQKARAGGVFCGKSSVELRVKGPTLPAVIQEQARVEYSSMPGTNAAERSREHRHLAETSEARTSRACLALDGFGFEGSRGARRG